MTFIPPMTLPVIDQLALERRKDLPMTSISKPRFPRRDDGPQTPESVAPSERDRLAESFLASLAHANIDARTRDAVVESALDGARKLDRDSGKPSTKAMFDLRAEQDYVYPSGRSVIAKHGNSPYLRDIRTIDSIVIHQTGVPFGISDALVRRSDGDRDLARARRALDVPCHVLAFRQGFFAVAHALPVWINHAGPLNQRSIGLEVDGRYAGLVDDPKTVAREDLATTWDGEPEELTELAVQSACAAIDWICKEVRSMGGEISHIFAHRQSSSDRRSDPGEAIWKRVVLDHAVRDRRLKTRPELTFGSGRPIPKEWDPAASAKY